MKDHQMKEFQLLKEVPIIEIDFLTRFVRETKFQIMSKTRAFVALPNFRTGFAKC